MFSLRSRKDKWRILSVGAASFLTIFPLCVWRHLDVIEKDIYDRGLEALSTANIGGLDLTVDGRDVSLSGAVPDLDLVRAKRLLEALNGVRVVNRSSPLGGEGSRN